MPQDFNLADLAAACRNDALELLDQGFNLGRRGILTGHEYVLIQSHVLITFLFLVSFFGIQRRASDEPGKGSKDRSNVRAETREDGAYSPIWQARPSVQPPAGWSKLGGIWRKREGRKQEWREKAAYALIHLSFGNANFGANSSISVIRRKSGPDFRLCEVESLGPGVRRDDGEEFTPPKLNSGMAERACGSHSCWWLGQLAVQFTFRIRKTCKSFIGCRWQLQIKNQKRWRVT